MDEFYFLVEHVQKTGKAPSDPEEYIKIRREIIPDPQPYFTLPIIEKDENVKRAAYAEMLKFIIDFVDGKPSNTLNYIFLIQALMAKFKIDGKEILSSK